MNLWLKAEGYSVVKINQLPTGMYAIQIVSSWLGTTLAAIYPSWMLFSGASFTVFFSAICMIVWNIPQRLKSVLIYFSYVYD